MVTVDKQIVNPGSPRMIRTVRHICDECETRCDPDSYDARDWLYSFNGKQLCWECFMCESGASKVE